MIDVTDIEIKRAYVSDLYSWRSWKRKVSKMPDRQIIAIFLQEKAGHPPKANSEIEEPESVIDPEPIVKPLPVMHGPHANEDDFPIY